MVASNRVALQQTCWQTCRQTWRRMFVATVTVSFSASFAVAQTTVDRTNAITSPDCALETLRTGTARRIIDGRTFHLGDGQHIRLAAIDVPPMPIPRAIGPKN